MGDWTVDKLKENILAALVEAATQGHLLGEFKPVDGISILGYEAFCSKCFSSVFINDLTVNSNMPTRCPEKPVNYY